MLPLGQLLWLRELESYKEFPPLQAPESYNLDQVVEQVRAARTSSHVGQ
jgi:arylsulfatase